MALINKLSAIGDAIREKTGKEDLIKLDDMPTEIGNLANVSIEDKLLDGSLTGEYTNNRISRVAGHRFRASKITMFSSTSITAIDAYAFYGATNLIEINIPNLTTIEQTGFQMCSSLKKVNFPKVTGTIGAFAFS
jgi:hypothetical protein